MSEKRTFKVGMVESYVTIIYREELTIDANDYPQLDGMNDEEVLSHIESNSDGLFKKDDEENGYSLWDELMEQDINFDRIKNEEFEINVEKIDE